MLAMSKQVLQSHMPVNTSQSAYFPEITSGAA